MAAEKCTLEDLFRLILEQGKAKNFRMELEKIPELIEAENVQESESFDINSISGLIEISQHITVDFISLLEQMLEQINVKNPIVPKLALMDPRSPIFHHCKKIDSDVSDSDEDLATDKSPRPRSITH